MSTRQMSKRLWWRSFLACLFFSSLQSFPVEAMTTRTWRETEQACFDKGERQNVSTTSRDELILGPEVELVYDFAQLHIWSLVADAQGIIYAGTGNEGRIYKIKEGKGFLLHDSPEIAIHSLALDGEGNLFAGTSPGGIIYKLTGPEKTEVEVFVDLEEEFIWALVFDSRGYLLAGTGRQGRIYRISPDGEVELLFDSPESHILSLVIDEQDNLFAGSEGQGIIYKINKGGEVFALFDPPQNEVKVLALDSQGNLFAATMGVEPSPTPATLPPLPFPGKEKSPARATTSIVYKITPDGDHQEWFRSPDPLLLSMLIDDRDNLFLGTGNRGLIYKINPRQEVVTLVKAREPQILSLALGKKGSLYFGTGNPGRLHTFSRLYYAWEGTFTSQVHDATFVSRWGRISFRGEIPMGTTITLATRSGNTARPDVTWSPWSEEYTIPQGEPITSPPARFIQYRARLSTRDRSFTPVLREVSLAYLPRNQAPRIIALRVPALGRREITVSWQATDPNRDALLFNLYFRGEGGARWKELAREIRETSHSWDSLAFPDGIYFIKLIVNDSPDNPFPYALTDEKISPPFLIDNTRPRVENLRATLSDKVATVRGTAVDNLSPIKRIEYSVNAGDWRAIHPLDGILDSLSEPFEFILGELSPGEHTIVLKVTDEAGNIGSAKTVIEIVVSDKS